MDYYRLRKREPLIALGSQQVGPLFLHPRYPTARGLGGGGGGRADLNTLASRRWSQTT